MKTESKVGIFIVLGILSLLFLTFQVNSLQDFNKKGYTLYALVGDASGLSKKAKIKLRGVMVGDVENMALDGNRVKLKLFIKNNVKIPLGSYVTLAQDNFLGGKYLKIIPSNSNEYFTSGGVIKKYISNASMADVMNNINSVVNDAKVFIKKMNKVLDKSTINNLHAIASNMKDSSVYLKTVLKQTSNKLPELLNNTDSMISEYKKTGKLLNKKLPVILNKTHALLVKFNKTGDIINEKIGKLIDEYTNVGKNANSILKDNKKSIKQTIVSAKSFFINGGESFKKIDNYLSSLTKSQILVNIQSDYMFDDNYFKTKANIMYLPVPTKYYILGITSSKDYSDLSTINLPHQKDKVYISAEYGKRYDNLLLRGGIIENTGGLGFDYFLNHDQIKLSADIYDFNAVNDIRGDNPNLTLQGSYTYLKHIQFIGGVDNILNEKARDFFLGVGVKFKDNDLKALLSGGASSFLK